MALARPHSAASRSEKNFFMFGWFELSAEVAVNILVSRFDEAVKTAASRWIHGDKVVRAVVADGLWRVDPVGRVQVRILLQSKTRGGRRPCDSRAGGREALDGQQRRIGRLHDEQRPEAARKRERAARHRSRVRVRLADGTAQRKVCAAAGAAAAINGVPVDAELRLCHRSEGQQAEAKGGE